MPSIADARRLRALERTGLMSSLEDTFDRLARLASELIGTPVALVVGVSDSEQAFPGAHGLSGVWAEDRRTPLTHSFCQHVVRSDAVLDVPSSTEHPLVKDNLAIEDLGVAAYLGQPLHDDMRNVVGAVCVIDHEPRTWTEDDHRKLQLVVDEVEEQLRLRLALADEVLAATERRVATAAFASAMSEPAAASEAQIAAMRALHDDLPPEVLVHLDALDLQSRRVDQLGHALLLLHGREPARRERISLPRLLRSVVPPRRSLIRLGDRLELDVAPEILVSTDVGVTAEILGLLLDELAFRSEPDGRVRVSAATGRDGVVLRLVADADPADEHLRAALRPTGDREPETGVVARLRVARILADRVGLTLRLVADVEGLAIEVAGLEPLATPPAITLADRRRDVALSRA